MAKKETTIKDIFDGEFLNAWGDESMVYLNTPFATLNFLKDDWKAFINDMKKTGGFVNGKYKIFEFYY